MKTYDKNKRTRRIRIQDFLGGQYLSKEDVDEPIVVTIVGVAEENVKDEWKLVASLKELKKRLVLNSTNLQELGNLFRATYPEEIRGPVTLYVDQSVELKGKVVGGIRIRPAERQGESRGESADKHSHRNGHARREPFESEADSF